MKTGGLVAGDRTRFARFRTQGSLAGRYEPPDLLERGQDLADAGVQNRLAGIGMRKLAELFLVVQQVVAKHAHDGGALFERGVLPAVLRISGGAQHAMDVVRSVRLHVAQQLRRGRGVARDAIGGGGAAQLRLDVFVGQMVDVRVFVWVEGGGGQRDLGENGVGIEKGDGGGDGEHGGERNDEGERDGQHRRGDDVIDARGERGAVGRERAAGGRERLAAQRRGEAVEPGGQRELERAHELQHDGGAAGGRGAGAGRARCSKRF
ncbi:betaine aldehyde dehydrogenase [Gracilaria domingensis]|nr:betaine aldehyde dehydrogenase [Gracilaria domingensis]